MALSERLYLVHLQSGDACSAQFNPTELQEKLGVVWRELEVPGESHEPVEYGHTKNLKVKFDLAFDAASAQGIAFDGTLRSNRPDSTGATGGTNRYDGGDTLLVRRWLMACCYPMKGAESVRDAAPSKILVVWPRFYSLSMRLDEVEFKHRQWAGVNKPPILFTAELKFTADNDRRIFYEDVLASGTERNASNGAQQGG